EMPEKDLDVCFTVDRNDLTFGGSGCSFTSLVLVVGLGVGKAAARAARCALNRPVEDKTVIECGKPLSQCAVVAISKPGAQQLPRLRVTKRNHVVDRTGDFGYALHRLRSQ